jgi:redox-sensing transcriptional repressor
MILSQDQDGAFEHNVNISRPDVSPAVVKRLPKYFRYLRQLIREGRTRVSSAELSKMMNFTASQIRQDLNCFGGFGQQGYGYNIKYLYGKISELLGVTQGFKAVIVGAGNLGRALAATHMFERRGVERVALFDVNEEIVGTEIYGIKVYHTDELFEFCQRHKVDIGVLTVPKDAAYHVARTMASAGVKGIWNFANMELSLEDKSVIVENIHLGDSLMTLCYEIKDAREKAETKDED